MCVSDARHAVALHGCLHVACRFLLSDAGTRLGLDCTFNLREAYFFGRAFDVTNRG